MRLALALDPLQDGDLLFAQQLGVEDVMAETASVGSAPLAVMANRVRQARLRLVGLEGLPWSLYGHAVTAGEGTGRAEQEIARVKAIVREAGQAGIGQIGYGWGIPARGAVLSGGRGGAASPTYRWDDAGGKSATDREAEKLWSSLGRFLQQVLPEAEEAGVHLACQLAHPAMGLAGPHILHTLGDIDRLFGLAPSPNHGVDLDHGFFALEGNSDPSVVIRHVSEKGRLLSVRVRATVYREEAYAQGFLDQDRQAVLRAIQCYRDVSFQGTMRPAPPPAMAEDTAWGHKGYAFSIGYLRALLQACG